MKDFTFQAHQKLVESLLAKDYSFITFQEYLEGKSNLDSSVFSSKNIILRHDVERRYENALKFAKIQHHLGIKGTYFFRILPKSFKPEIVKQIADLDHEIGYHYDDLTECNGDYKKAIARFEKNLNTLREIAPVQTICMDGSPLSKFDNRDLWSEEMRDESVEISEEGGAKREEHREMREERGEKRREKTTHHLPLTTHYSFQDFGIIGEPYFDMDFNKFFYLTDTGRKWDGWKTSVRDKVVQQEDWVKQGLVFHSTQDIIDALGTSTGSVSSLPKAPEPVEGSAKTLIKKPIEVPNNIMFTFHPQRWSDGVFPWVKEMVLQRAKNFVKGFMVR